MSNLVCTEAAWNFRLGRYDYKQRFDDWRDYIPQSLAAQGLYNCHLALGKSSVEAASEVLSIIVGKKPPASSRVVSGKE